MIDMMVYELCILIEQKRNSQKGKYYFYTIKCIVIQQSAISSHFPIFGQKKVNKLMKVVNKQNSIIAYIFLLED